MQPAMQHICKTCGRERPAPPPPEPAVADKQAAEPVAEPAEPPEPPQFAAYPGYKFPNSVLNKIIAKLARVEINPAVESAELKIVLEAARDAYETKRERARLSSAAKRAAKKAATPAAQPEPVPAPAVPVAAA